MSIPLFARYFFFALRAKVISEKTGNYASQTVKKNHPKKHQPFQFFRKYKRPLRRTDGPDHNHHYRDVIRWSGQKQKDLDK